MKRILLLLVPVTVLLASCNLFDNYGKKVQINSKSNVYYKGDGVTEADAKKLGDYLLKQEYFDDKNEASAQITKDGDTYVVRMVVNTEKLKEEKEKKLNFYWVMQSLIAENVFENAKTKIILTDEKLKDIETLPKATRLAVPGAIVYLKGEGVTEEQAKKLASILEEHRYFEGKSPNIVLEKKDGVYSTGFVYDKDYYNENKDNVLALFKMIQWLFQEEAFNNANTRVNLTDSYFNSYTDVGQFTQEEKTALVQQGQQTQDANPQTDDVQVTDSSDH
jgi:hypothetical protein